MKDDSDIAEREASWWLRIPFGEAVSRQATNIKPPIVYSGLPLRNSFGAWWLFDGVAYASSPYLCMDLVTIL
jgi:hypothetical protein